MCQNAKLCNFPLSAYRAWASGPKPGVHLHALRTHEDATRAGISSEYMPHMPIALMAGVFHIWDFGSKSLRGQWSEDIGGQVPRFNEANVWELNLNRLIATSGPISLSFQMCELIFASAGCALCAASVSKEFISISWTARPLNPALFSFCAWTIYTPAAIGGNPSKIQEFTLMRPTHGNL